MPYRLSAVPPAAEPPVLNSTPLIDVMLVLLVMFILTIPAGTHKVPIDLPGAAPVPPAEAPIVHRIGMDARGALSWDGVPIGDAELPRRLAAARAAGDPEIQLRIDGEAPYGPVDRLLATVKRSGLARLGFVGNERFATF